MTGAVSTKTLTSLPGGAGDDELRQGLEHAFEDVVVVAVAGIDGDGGSVGAGERGERVGIGGVGEAEGDDAAGLGPEGLRVGALVGSVGEPAHVAVFAGGQEVLEPVTGLGGECRGGEADGVEAESEGAVSDQVFQGWGHGSGKNGAGAAGIGGEKSMCQSAQVSGFG